MQNVARDQTKKQQRLVAETREKYRKKSGKNVARNQGSKCAGQALRITLKSTQERLQGIS